MRTVELGYFVNPEYVPGYPLLQGVREQQELVAQCRELGMRAVVVGEHLSRGHSVWMPPLLLLGRLAEHGEGMIFGTGVLVAPLRHPVALAEQVAFLDALTGGNFALGLSAGWHQGEFASLGIPMKGRGARLEEAIEILRLLWSAEEPASFAGVHYAFDDVAISLKPVRAGGPPIWIGASSERALRRAADLGDAWIASSHLSNEQVVEQAARYRAFRQEAGRPLPDLRPGLRNLYVARTREQAIQEAGPYLTQSYSMFNEWGLFDDVLKQGRAEVDYERAAGRAIVGDPEAVAEELVAFLRGSDVNLLLARMQWLGMPHAQMARCLELLATEVMPLVNRELASAG